LTLKYETYAYLKIRDFDCDYSEITKIMGIEATEAYNKGSYHPKAPQAKRKTSLWALYSLKPRTEIFLDVHIESVLEQIEPRKEAIQVLAASYYVGIQCVGYYTNANPGFHLSNLITKRIAVLGLWVDFDLVLLL
jgi:hypothetical protein